jgi:hypothetical protein
MPCSSSDVVISLLVSMNPFRRRQGFGGPP